ncbi:MAG: hypothetical protein Q8L79_06230 [Methylobacter sp.]|uniref:hypothetical protein n=1 Tax=Methylobacter sp. TaxID=2051955 RepID=UPI00272F2F80|nr:hypothetical protein [Methylobacter sp.]MDP1664710.1 hypothetical protein [Methylobacter sp.]
MQQFTLKMSYTLVLAVAVILTTGPALADKPSRNNHDKAGKHEQREKQNHDRDRDDRAYHSKDADNQRRYFDDRHQTIVHDYYNEQFRTGRCPPGLLKKHNGCMPPGQAKQWQIGRPLPRNVIYYDLPPNILAQLGQPQPGYRYARVGADVLLLRIGTGLVVDALLGMNR